VEGTPTGTATEGQAFKRTRTSAEEEDWSLDEGTSSLIGEKLGGDFFWESGECLRQ